MFAKARPCPWQSSGACGLFGPCDVFGSHGFRGYVRAATPLPNNLGPMICSSPYSIASNLVLRSPNISLQYVLGMLSATLVSISQQGCLNSSTVGP